MNRLKNQWIPTARLCLLLFALFSIQLFFGRNQEPQGLGCVEAKQLREVVRGLSNHNFTKKLQNYYCTAPPVPK